MGNRHTAFWTVPLALMLAVTLAGCGSTKPKAAPKPVPKHELRGVPVTKLACPPHPTSPTAKATGIVGVQSMLLCPTRVPGVGTKAVTITDRQPGLATLIAALSVPDESSTTGACPAYADLPQIVLAKTAHGVYQVSIPVDACRHYQQRALKALAQARGN